MVFHIVDADLEKPRQNRVNASIPVSSPGYHQGFVYVALSGLWAYFFFDYYIFSQNSNF